MQARSVRGFLLAALIAGAVAGLRPSVAHADVCGGDNLPDCPSITEVTPHGWDAGAGRVTVTITGRFLAEARDVTLQPLGRSLPIASVTDTSIVVTAPGDLGAGGYTLHIEFGGYLNGASADSQPLYIASGAAAPPPAASFAPNPSLVTAAPAAVGTQRPAAVPAQPSSHGFIFFLGGLLAGGVVCLVIARRLGLTGGDRPGSAGGGRRRRDEDVALQRIWAPDPVQDRQERPAPQVPTAPQTTGTPPAAGPGWSVRPQSPRFRD